MTHGRRAIHPPEHEIRRRLDALEMRAAGVARLVVDGAPIPRVLSELGALRSGIERIEDLLAARELRRRPRLRATLRRLLGKEARP
jgi:hypothetical protein